MKAISEISIRDFRPWSGAVHTWRALGEAGKFDAFDQLIEELYPEGITDVELNDILWFEPTWIWEMLGMPDPDKDDDEESDNNNDPEDGE